MVAAPCDVTFKVDGAVSVHVRLLHNLGDLARGELLSQKPLHGLLQLCEGDLPVPVGVKLRRAEGWCWQ